MFEGEALGLQALGASATVAVPKVLHWGDETDGRGSFIVMEHLQLGGGMDMREFGRAMAQMHLAEPADENAKQGKFGFPVDNTIGGTPQLNGWSDNWVAFFRDQRMAYQVKRAQDNFITSAWQRVLERTNNLEDLFTDGDIKPSVLHGDLWSGNYSGSNRGPAIYDPAVYYGHHEAEWGMSWCASLSGSFWEGYRELIPEAPLFGRRRTLYEAYHILNHYNLFGGSYGSQAKSLMDSL
eukprot:TRINITY_DN27576_c0_g1_i4.p1 TRINITY_DN27576_c0_g1~~TRINITY_DN27576_c0_g1_i4.p1  ORF type:complete len:238 (-),score=33.13 TRINITY_DN27576_c0_g1_i4:321-1034(-)